jgi:HSP20 family protein
MKLVKYHPHHGPFDALFENLNSNFFPARSTCGPQARRDASQRLPRTNIEETESAYVLTMEMPGLSRKDVEVSLEGDTLIVKGDRVVDKVEKDEKAEMPKSGFLRHEIQSSKFERSFSLGNEVDQENIRAKMQDGILIVTLTRKTEEVGRKVDVS